ncbi:hypothetical protein C0J52_09939 [Blattella germanica]|nr:hypothetical protein C0J52_09939 [Blattella germanica]
MCRCSCSFLPGVQEEEKGECSEFGTCRRASGRPRAPAGAPVHSGARLWAEPMRPKMVLLLRRAEALKCDRDDRHRKSEQPDPGSNAFHLATTMKLESTGTGRKFD